MPKKKPGEKKDDWMARCVPDLMGEGRSRDQAVAICLGMYTNNMEWVDEDKQPQ